jgi:6-phosphogluconolactonase
MLIERKEIIIKTNAQELSASLAKTWVKLSKQAISQRGIFTVALSGGRTPIPIYKNICSNQNIAWDKNHIFLTDERFVPLNHLDSNYRMIKQNLLKGGAIPTNNIHPFKIKDTAKLTAKEYEKALKHFFNLNNGQFPKFDLIILGLGQDGHIASLFPKNKSLQEKNRMVVETFVSDVKHERISFSLPVINNARNIIFLVAGSGKAGIIKEVLINRNRKFPASWVDSKEANILFLLDKEAGRLVSRLTKML